jgi:hypothetical protein
MLINHVIFSHAWLFLGILSNVGETGKFQKEEGISEIKS